MVNVVKDRQREKIEYTFSTLSGRIKMTTDWFSREVKRIELYDYDDQRISKQEIDKGIVIRICGICERFRQIEERKSNAQFGFGLGLLVAAGSSIGAVFSEGTGGKIMGYVFGGGCFLAALACAKVWRSSVTRAKAIEEEFREVSYPSRNELNAAALQELQEDLERHGLEFDIIVA